MDESCFRPFLSGWLAADAGFQNFAMAADVPLFLFCWIVEAQQIMI